MAFNNSISIVIPLYNGERTIGRAINSIRNQTFTGEIEIIIVDDGSTDAGAKVINNFEDARIRQFYQNNAGVSSARNYGIGEARNDYICFLDADDEWEPEYLQTISELIRKYPNCVGAGTAYFHGIPGGKKYPVIPATTPFTEDNGLLTDYFKVALRSAPPIWTSAVCVKKEKIVEIGGFPSGVRAGEDLLTWARLATMGEFAYCTRPLSTYWQDRVYTYDSTPTNSPDRYDPVGLGLLKLYRNYSGPQKCYLRKYIGVWHKMRASVFIRQGKNLEALKEIIKSIHYGNFEPRVFAYILMLTIPQQFRNRIFKKFSRQGNIKN